MLQRELGFNFNIHLFRHLGCFVYLRNHPGEIDFMRRVLGHRDPTTTRRFYADVEQSDAFGLFEAHVIKLTTFVRSSVRPSPTLRFGEGAHPNSC